MSQKLPDISLVGGTASTNNTQTGDENFDINNISINITTPTTPQNDNSNDTTTVKPTLPTDSAEDFSSSFSTTTTATQTLRSDVGETTTASPIEATTTSTVSPTATTTTTDKDVPASFLTSTPPVDIQAPLPTAPVPTLKHSCPDLRDRISIDISITTTTTKANKTSTTTNINNSNNQNTIINSNNNKPASDIDSASGKPLALRQNMAAPRRSGNGLVLSTADHSIGTVVQVSCAAQQQHSAVVLECGPGGVWNATVPSCSGSLDASQYPLYFAVAGGAVGLILLVLCILYCHLLRTRKNGGGDGRKSTRDMKRSRDVDENVYVDPYHVGERLYHSPNSPHYARSDIAYAKPVVYSTYLNPAFYEDAYERWRRQEQMVSEKLYDSPWLKPRGLQRQMETSGFRWSQTSLKAIGDSGFKKLPRAQLDHASIRSNTSIGSAARSRDRRHGQSPAAVSCEVGMLRRYPSMAAHDPRPSTMAAAARDTRLDPRPLTLAAPEEVLTEDNESMTEFEMNSMDGLTNL